MSKAAAQREKGSRVGPRVDREGTASEVNRKPGPWVGGQVRKALGERSAASAPNEQASYNEDGEGKKTGK